MTPCCRKCGHDADWEPQEILGIEFSMWWCPECLCAVEIPETQESYE